MSKWAYLIVFEPAFASRKQVQDALDQMPEVNFWHACLPNAVFATAGVTAKTLAAKLEEKFDVSKGQKFLVAELADDRQGRLPKQAWHLLRNPENPRLKKS